MYMYRLHIGSGQGTYDLGEGTDRRWYQRHKRGAKPVYVLKRTSPGVNSPSGPPNALKVLHAQDIYASVEITLQLVKYVMDGK